MSVPSSKSMASRPTGHFGAGRLPSESARDHQVDDEKQLALGLHDDALAEP
jgi:hypothetical protein